MLSDEQLRELYIEVFEKYEMEINLNLIDELMRIYYFGIKHYE